MHEGLFRSLLLDPEPFLGREDLAHDRFFRYRRVPYPLSPVFFPQPTGSPEGAAEPAYVFA